MMPQLDPSSFISQLFWLAVIFSLLFITISKIALPSIKAILDNRSKKIEDDLKLAKEAKEEAEKLLTEYNSAIKDAKSKASELTREASLSSKAEFERNLLALNQEIDTKLKAAEEDFAKEKSKLIKELDGFTDSITSTIITKLTGLNVPEEEIKKI
jgi:F-type H+-transporting ATPase subunit b